MFHTQYDITISNITNAAEVCDSSITFGFSFYYRFPRNTVIPSVVICGFETGSVSQDDLSQNGFSHEGLSKWEDGSIETIMTNRKDVYILNEKFTRNMTYYK